MPEDALWCELQYLSARPDPREALIVPDITGLKSSALCLLWFFLDYDFFLIFVIQDISALVVTVLFYLRSILFVILTNFLLHGIETFRVCGIHFFWRYFLLVERLERQIFQFCNLLDIDLRRLAISKSLGDLSIQSVELCS